MTFTVLDMDQRSSEWHRARLGRLTGSCASDMLASVKTAGAEAATRRDLRMRLVLDRLTGESQDDGYVNGAMQWGIDHEADACAAYEAQSGHLVRHTGFLSCAEYMVGCSLDGDVDNFTGIVEIKAPKSATHYGYLKARTVPANHLAQIHHNLWVTGAQWCDFASFDPRFPEPLQLFVCRIPRVEIDVLAYEKVAVRFLAEVDAELESARQLMLAGAVA